jgi:hypothetical protein
MFSDKITNEINSLPLQYQKEVFDFILFLKSKIKEETDTDYLSKDPEIKQSIINGLNTPLNECFKKVNW